MGRGEWGNVAEAVPRRRGGRLEVGETPHRQDPPVGGKKRRGRGKSVGGFLPGPVHWAIALLDPGCDPVALFLFFCSGFFFLFSALVSLFFEVQKYFGNKLLNW
jgi:hypothetical protein